MSFLAKLRAFFTAPPKRDANGHFADCAVYNAPALPAGPCDCRPPITLKATVQRSSLRPNGQPQASVDIENGVTALVLTETKLSTGSEVKVRLAACGWEIA